MRIIAEVGDKRGRLTVLRLISIRTPGQPSRRAAECECECGTAVTVLLQNLYRGHGTISCGCAKRRGSMTERFATTRADPGRLHRTTHGLSRHPSYHRWKNMLDRCNNPAHPAYKNYGARGIRVAQEWHDPTVFLDYLDTTLGPPPAGRSLDRIDNNGPYAPGNIRWATAAEQIQNRRPRS